MFKFFTVMMLGKLVKIFNYLCLALFGTIDGKMFFFLKHDGNMFLLNDGSWAGMSCMELILFIINRTLFFTAWN